MFLIFSRVLLSKSEKKFTNKRFFPIPSVFLLTFNFQDLIANSPFLLLDITLLISYENLLLDQDNIFCLISLCILITYLLDNVWIFQGEVIC